MNKNYLSLIYGFLLGESYIFKNPSYSSKKGAAIRREGVCKEIKLIIKIEGKHISYMRDIHTKISNLGYCEQKFPKIIRKLRKKGKLNKLMLLHTYNNNNYLELYNKWYVDKLHKNIPYDIGSHFNEESLAYLLMTEGKIKNRKLYLNMTQFNNRDIKIIKQFLEKKFKLDQINLNNNCLEFNANNILKIYNITKPYILPSMKFKFITAFNLPSEGMDHYGGKMNY